MSFADGLESGINLSLKISALQLQKEQEERLRDKATLDAITSQSTIQKNLLEAEKTQAEIQDLNYKNTAQYRAREEAVVESTINWRDTVSADIKQGTEEAVKIAQRNDDIEDWNLTTEFLSSAMRWSKDPQLIELRQSNAPEWQAWQNNSLKILNRLQESGSGHT